MDKRQRLAFLGIAVAIAAVAVVVALVSGGGDDGSTTTQASDTQQTQQDTTQQQDATEPPAGGAPVKPEPQPPKPEPVEIGVKDGEPVGGLEKIKVKKNETVEILVTADHADEAHLHGYNIEKALEPGKTARFRFKADIEGVFELELHHSGAQIARITVEP